MKKQLLMLGLGLLGSVTMSAQLSSPFTGAQPSDEIDAKADYSRQIKTTNIQGKLKQLIYSNLQTNKQM